MNKSITIIWEDDDLVTSYIPAAKWYGLEILKAVECDVYKTEVTLYGLAKDVDKFLEDFNEGSVEPLETLSRENEFDEDYIAALQAAC